LLLDVNERQQRVLQEQTTGLTCQFSRRGTEFLVLQTGGTVAIFDAAGNSQTTLESIDQHFVAAAFVQGGTHVVTASRDRLSVWETASGAGVYDYPWDGNAVAATGANWTPDSASPGEFLTNNGDRLERWPLDVIEFTAGTTRALTAEERCEIKLRSQPAEP